MAKTTVQYTIMATRNNGCRLMLYKYNANSWRQAQRDYRDNKANMLNNGITALELCKVTTTMSVEVKQSAVCMVKHAKE